MNALGSKSLPFLAATFGRMALWSVWNVGGIEVWRAIFLLCEEPLVWPAGDIGSSFCLNNALLYFTPFLDSVNNQKPLAPLARHALMVPYQGPGQEMMVKNVQHVHRQDGRDS